MISMSKQQPELFPSSTAPLHGLEVVIQSTTARPCCREAGLCVLGYGAGNGMHAASITCCGCGAHRGWLGRQTAQQIEAIIKQFGRPDQPIIVRR
jgi:hypothetical protein